LSYKTSFRACTQTLNSSVLSHYTNAAVEIHSPISHFGLNIVARWRHSTERSAVSDSHPMCTIISTDFALILNTVYGFDFLYSISDRQKSYSK